MLLVVTDRFHNLELIMSRLTALLKRGLMIWGGISLLGIIIFYATIAYQIGTREKRTVENDDQDVRFVLDWFGQRPDEKANIVHSYHPTGSWSGDYTKAFAMKLARIEASELNQQQGMSRGDKLTPVIRNAVAFVLSFTDERQVPWFPKSDQILSNKYYVYPVRMVLLGSYPDSAHLLFIRPADSMVFFIAVKI